MEDETFLFFVEGKPMLSLEMSIVLASFIIYIFINEDASILIKFIRAREISDFTGKTFLSI